MKNNESRFRFKLPGGWEDQTVFSFRGPSEDDMEHNLLLVIDRHLQYDDIEDYAVEKTMPLTESMPDLIVMKNEEVTVEGGNPCFEFVAKWIPSEDSTVIQKHVFVFSEGLGFHFSINFNKKTYKLLNLQLGQVIESILPGTYEPFE